MVHASVRSVGEVAGGPDQIHLALKDALTPHGTLMMYASCPTYYDEVGRGHLSTAQERELLELPAYDAVTARSQRDNGALVRAASDVSGSLVNSHVAWFVVWGTRGPPDLEAAVELAFGRVNARTLRGVERSEFCCSAAITIR
jgi:aminoglycoside 3-N-acetyltransferase